MRLLNIPHSEEKGNVRAYSEERGKVKLFRSRRVGNLLDLPTYFHCFCLLEQLHECNVLTAGIAT